MNLSMSLVFLMLLGTSFLILFAFSSFQQLSREAERILALVHSEREDRRTVRWRERMTNLLTGSIARLRRRVGLHENSRLQTRFQEAGIRNTRSSDLFFATQAFGVLSGASLGSFLHDNTLFWIFTGCLVGFMAPDVWLTTRQKKRKERMRRGIPDAVDLMVICVDAGLGLDQALLRVRDSLSVSHPDLNEELERLNYELLAGTPRIEAWQRLAARTRIEELVSFASILAETDRFGTPITKALIGYSEELRLKRRQHAEEAAAKTKVKIIFPLVLCIFPCIFIVLLAPALLDIAQGMTGIGK